MIPLLNSKVPEATRYIDWWLNEKLPFNSVNTYFSLKEIEPNFDMLCAHAMFKQPFFRIENNHLMLSFKMADSFVNIDHYCDNDD
mmetsp:Transcript_21767/g.33617  ORF Transcript_21767/g.33617 Transcript_21767/m.33617 type:complete len:85 (+) Transcript_21767:1238-1492(+)